MNKYIICAVSMLAIGELMAGPLDDIKNAVQDAKDKFAQVIEEQSKALTDAELLTMLRAQYAADMKSGNYAKWHGALSHQIVIDPPQGATNNNAKMEKVFADGFTVTNNFRKSTPRTDLERKILAAKREEQRRREQLKELKKQIEEMKAGVPLAALEAKAKNLEAALDKATTNLVITVGSSSAASGR